MNIYFTASTRDLDLNKKKYNAIIDVLKKYNHHVADSWLLDKLNGENSELTSQEILLKNIQLVQECDFAIVEISIPSFGVGYFIGQAIANHKKILCLYPENMEKDALSEIIAGTTSGHLSQIAYTENNLEKKLRDFIAGFKIDDLRKFNFIATQEIVQFIEREALREKKSKSEYLRDKILKEIINKS